MAESVVSFFRSGLTVALVGNPNCGKTALFNLLTGSRQKVGNYAGVTVERKVGGLTLPSGKKISVLDLPGTYSLIPRSPDERVTCDVLLGRAIGEKCPDLVVCVVDATNLRRTLRLLLAVHRLGIACVVALNMSDLAKKRGSEVNASLLATLLGLPVVATVATQSGGGDALIALLNQPEAWAVVPPLSVAASDDHLYVNTLLEKLGLEETTPFAMSDRIDKVVLHPVYGLAILSALLFLMFQAVFIFAEFPMKAIEATTTWLGAAAGSFMPSGWLKSLVVDGVIAGLGGVLVFLPQIFILFFFILALEESGYLPRAAFLLDRLMSSVGLSGRSFIPLLSSFACAVPGIMAARSISNPRDRLVTIMIAPLMTCSARLPVYALLISAFIPKRTLMLGIEQQGLVLFALYVAGIVGAMTVAFLLKKFTSEGRNHRPLLMELPMYHWPTFRNIGIGLWQRVVIFLKRVGGVVFILTLALWFLATFPTGGGIENSFAGLLGRGLAVIFEPIGFNWQICVALVPGMAAREVVVSSLATVYALSATGDDAALALSPLIASQWSLPTALSLLAWFVFAPQCFSTLAVVKRETGGYLMPVAMAAYLFGLAYIAAYATYKIAFALML